MDHEFKEVVVYADSRDNLFVIPTGESKRFCGATMEIDLLIHLLYPYNDEDLEESLLRAMDTCFTKEPDDAPGYKTVMEKYLKIKGYAKAVKDKRCISFHWDIDDGYSITPSENLPKRGYVSIKEKTIWLGKKIKKGELARALKEAMKISTS